MNEKTNQLLVATPADMIALGGRLVEICSDPSVVYLRGELGTGKTTLVRGFLRRLGYIDAVKSPTYPLVESYNIAGRLIYHFDFYRINDSQELENIGIRDYFAHPAISLIEWPERGGQIIPSCDLECSIEILPSGYRIVKFICSAKIKDMAKVLKHG